MTEIHLLSKDERKTFFEAAVAEIQIAMPIIEKDFWVVWTLERLFSLPELKTHLTFKGGTSLSKVYGIIERFSEDIDLSIEKSFLGFDKENDPEKAPSKKKQKEAIDQLANCCANYVQNKVLMNLREGIAEKLGFKEKWNVVIDPKDPDQQSILFEYPNITEKSSYIQQAVKIEIGARSEHWPVSFHTIQSYVKEALKEKVTETEIRVRVLNAERTFWEKATILHQYAHLPKDKKLPPRISRHFYDFFCLLNSAIKEKAFSDISLLERVATHKNTYFSCGWANYGAARKGTLKLVPPDGILEELEKDYALMETMFFREIPDWNLILNAITKFEHEFNV